MKEKTIFFRKFTYCFGWNLKATKSDGVINTTQLVFSKPLKSMLTGNRHVCWYSFCHQNKFIQTKSRGV